VTRLVRSRLRNTCPAILVARASACSVDFSRRVFLPKLILIREPGIRIHRSLDPNPEERSKVGPRKSLPPSWLNRFQFRPTFSALRRIRIGRIFGRNANPGSEVCFRNNRSRCDFANCAPGRVGLSLDALPLHEKLQIPLKLRRDVEIKLLHIALIQPWAVSHWAVSQTIGTPCRCSTDSTSVFIIRDAS